MAQEQTAINIKAEEKAPLVTPAPAPKAKRPHIPALDTVRFFLISYIVVGHFIQVATKNELLLRLCQQINVVVGAFFVISGYVAAYTATEVGKLEPSPRLAPASTYIITKILGYYHLHFLVTVLFLPMFAWADWYYNGVTATAINGVMSFTLTQAWFPMHAEVWNAPMWFLSAMTFAYIPMPAAITAIAKLNKKGLTLCMAALTGSLLLARLAYTYDLDCWSIMEGRLNARTHPNISFWNTIRFNPAYALIEMLMGAVAVRFVMLDGIDGEEKPSAAGVASSPVLPLLAMLAVLVARAYDVLPLNDALTRSVLFIPLFIMFLLALHRQTVYGSGAYRLNELMAASWLTYLGGISFPIFVIHGPLGQLFYKKVVAQKVFSALWQEFGWTGWPAWFFFVYLASVVLGAMLLQHGFLNQKAVKDFMASLGKYLSALFK
jgi:peptidoglycan/LPS O-acetylase OafA/YrhL|eukprot:CAMPEP_0174286202 /NCGR_PEP_ID=MMETSP0809-20121228/10862_1 /TAXON_ID=73025 ORGANISM="Eutreptiella gymnastica-like, Strain CCMP1594" /NCGR_SAMPLE_ID=MMETSP0809 /ASSEMBLY_ACC=CAM_ASM_000658 /LENGTH=434 /DNA_ID=CAMNT_0015382179 /DNA_START=31 /DNA_END=1335 /DNA_ORIENTATION=-